MVTEKYSAPALVLITCVSIIFMLDMRIGDTSTSVHLTERREDPCVVVQDNVKLIDTAGSDESDKEELQKDEDSLCNSSMEDIPPQRVRDSDIVSGIREQFPLTEIPWPKWEEVQKRVEGNNIDGKNTQDMDINFIELNEMIKSIPAQEKYESMMILTKLKKEDIAFILKTYEDGVTKDEEKAVREVLRNALSSEDYEKIMKIAEESYVKQKTGVK